MAALVHSLLIGSSSFFEVTRATIKTKTSLNLKWNQTQTVDLTALEHYKIICIDIKWGIFFMATLAPSFLNGSFSVLQVSRTPIKG